MAGNKRPKKRYNPRKHAMRPTFVSVDEAYRIFDPVRSILAILRGEVETINGYPVMKDWEGTYSRVDYALIGWAECWDRLFGTTDNEPIRRLAAKLANGVPVFEEDLLAVDAILDVQQRAMVRMRVEDVTSSMTTQQIAVELETLGLREAA